MLRPSSLLSDEQNTVTVSAFGAQVSPNVFLSLASNRFFFVQKAGVVCAFTRVEHNIRITICRNLIIFMSAKSF